MPKNTPKKIIDYKDKELGWIKAVMARNLKDTPFSINRLFVWAVGIYGLIGVIAICILGVLEKPIPPQVQSLTMFAVGAMVARIEKLVDK